MKKIILIILISSFTFSQDFKPHFNQNSFITIYRLPFKDSKLRIFYLYKIPINQLIFTKNSENYFAGINLTLEIFDSSSNFVKRDIKFREVALSDFSQTSDPKLFIEGVIQFELKNADYTLKSRFTDKNSGKDILIKEEKITGLISSSVKFFNPILLTANKASCDENELDNAANFGGSISFDEFSYNLLIPSKDTSVSKIFIKIISKRDTILSEPVQLYHSFPITLSECNNNIVLNSDTASYCTNNFLITDFSNKLKEGEVEIQVSEFEDFKNKESFKMFVKWIVKPISLLDSENAIKLLKFMISEDSVNILLKNAKNYDSILNLFWKKYDPTPMTEFNELMTEYYERIDFVNKEYSTISGLKGVNSDRGKIFILYGKPNNVERAAVQNGKISEIWTYTKLQKKFVFVDEKGTGDFVRKSSQ